MAPDELKKNRQTSKACNFGLIYLISPMGFVRHAKIGYGVTISEKTAISWMDLFFGKYAGIRRYHSQTIAFCKEHGYVESPFGRRRRLPDIHSPDRGVQGEATRQAVNHPVQSASSDVSLLTMIELRRTKVLDKRVKLRGFIHDELIFSLPRDKKLLRDTARTIYEVMVNPPLERDFGIKMLVPLESDMKIGLNMGDTKEYKLRRYED
jgi:DNA polymerase I